MLWLMEPEAGVGWSWAQGTESIQTNLVDQIVEDVLETLEGFY